MKPLLLMCFLFFCSVSLAVPALADEEEDYEKDARYAEGTPPMVPHRIEENATGESCLVCHLAGKNGAPLSPHSVRLDCTGCHGQGEIKEKKPEKKKLDKTKKQHE